MEREGSEEPGEEAEEDGRAPGTGEGHNQPGSPADPLRDHTAQPRRKATSVPPQRAASRHLLQTVAVA